MGSGSLAGTIDKNVGIIPRVIADMFNRMNTMKDSIPGAEFKVKVQFIEIYGENIVDLLDPTPDGSLVSLLLCLSNCCCDQCTVPSYSHHGNCV